MNGDHGIVKQLRAVIEEADTWAKQGKPKRAMEVLRSVLPIITEGSTKALLQKMERDLGAAPATSK